MFIVFAKIQKSTEQNVTKDNQNCKVDNQNQLNRCLSNTSYKSAKYTQHQTSFGDISLLSSSERRIREEEIKRIVEFGPDSNSDIVEETWRTKFGSTVTYRTPSRTPPNTE